MHAQLPGDVIARVPAGDELQDGRQFQRFRDPEAIRFGGTPADLEARLATANLGIGKANPASTLRARSGTSLSVRRSVAYQQFRISLFGGPPDEVYRSVVTLTIELEREDDGRWLAEVPSLSGVLCYGRDRDEAVAKAQALALRVIAERLEHREAPAELLKVTFQAA